jgi:putative ABC transport system permease protein
MQLFYQDLRYGARMLLKTPSATLIAVITLALGIGANTAIFSVVNATLLRSLPYHNPERLVHLWEVTPQKLFPQREASYPDYLDWQQSQVFEALAAYTGGGFTLTGRGTPEQVQGARGSANFFSTLGIEPIIGRSFRPGEDKEGAANVVLLSYGLWQRQFGGDPAIVGQSLTLNGSPHSVIGVLPPTFQFAPRGGAEIWAPFVPSEAQRSRRYLHSTNVIGRLKPGVSIEQATVDLRVIGGRIAEEHSESHTGTSIRIIPLHEEIIGDVKPILLLLLGTVIFVLLIACANVASLMLVRATGRQREIAIRLALGATRWRIARQLLTESVLLALAGGLCGLLLAQLGVDALIAVIPANRLSAMPYLQGLSLDVLTLTFTAGLSLLTGLVSGLAPAFQAGRRELNNSLKEGGRTAGVARHHLRHGLVITEIALALVLLVGAGLMAQSLWRLLRADPGFRTENLFMIVLALPTTKYTENDQIATFHQQLLARLETMPGIESAATTGSLPLIGGNTGRFIVEGESAPLPGQQPEANLRDVSTGYFRTMGITLVAGRYFTERDNTKAPNVVIVNQALVRRLFPVGSAVGQRLIFTGEDRTPMEIIGVVGDEKVNGLDARTTPVVYYSFLQAPDRVTNLIVRAPNVTKLIGAIRREGLLLEPDLAFFGGWTIEQLIDSLPATFVRRYPALLIGIFAMVALVLSVVGIYGAVSYSVSQRTHELGIRMALGAQEKDVLKLVLGQGVKLTSLGVAIGLASALVLTRLLSILLFGVSATDPLTFAGVATLLAVVALLACWVPARRATKVDPMFALRIE